MTAENRGRGRVAPSTVILAQRGSPNQGQGGMTPWMRRLKASVIQRPQAVESPGQGLGSALSLPWWNHLGDSSVAYAPSE